MGWIAHCIVTTDGHAPESRSEVPWVDPERYRYVFGIRVEAEAFPPIYMSATSLQRHLRLHSIRLSQFPSICDDELGFLLNEFRERTPGKHSPTTDA